MEAFAIETWTGLPEVLHPSHTVETKPQALFCPVCAEPIEVFVDLSAGNQHYVEDCEVCCRALDVRVEVRDFEVVSLRCSAAY